MSFSFESLADLVSGSPWTYAFVLAIAAVDALFPLVPSETTAIAAGVLAATGDLSIALVIAAATAGAFIGDTSSYGLGRALGDRVSSRLLPQKRRAWAERALGARGGALIIGARFIPGGRTAVTLTAGLISMPVRRYVRLAALAAVLWASYAALLGYVGGRAFEEHPWRGLVIALVAAAALALGIELVRRLVARLQRPALAPCGAC
jgi:membrane protein DedA with SNARE-associated domain